MENYILREKYLDKVKPFINKNLIKVFVGQRRVGKSYMIFQLMDFIKANFENSNLIYINLELLEFESLKDYKALYQYVKEKTVLKGNNYLFVDEIQLVSDFEKAINSILAEGNHDIYFTGSNANLLSGELSTLLRGRYIEIPIYPLSYEEFLLFHKLENSKLSLTNYLKYGGLPYLKNLQLNDEVVFDYLKNIQSAILYKDVVSRFSIRNIDFLNRLVIYLARQTGNIISARNISDYIKSQNISISVNIVLDYLVYLSTAFMIFRVRRTDITGKRFFEVGEKVYFSDVGIRNSISGYSPFDLGQIVENIVFLHLKSEGYSTYVGKQNDKEIDFIADKNGEKVYFQVSLRIDDKKTMERKFGNLLSISDNYPKYVITLDDYTGASNEGIKHLPLSEFLLNNW